MKRVLSITSAIILAFLSLFALLALFALVGDKPNAPLTAAPDLSVSRQISTGAFTIYLPIMQATNNNLAITQLNYAGNDEFVEIRNHGPGSQLFDGWKLQNVFDSQMFDFPSGVTLAPGEMLRVHSGPGAVSSPPFDLLWTNAFIWNNDGGVVQLLNSSGLAQTGLCYGRGCP